MRPTPGACGLPKTLGRRLGSASWTRLVEAGYNATELGPFGYLPTDLPTLRTELDRRGLKICGGVAMAHLEDPASWPVLEEQVLGAGAMLAALERLS